MIIDFSHDVDTYHELLAHYGKWSYTCPVCKSVGEWQRHGSYLRYLIVNEGNLYNIDYKWKTCHMKILRLRCKSCQHTHAILAKDMIPFTVYSIRSIVRIFCYKISNQNIELEKKIETELKQNEILNGQIYYLTNENKELKKKLDGIYDSRSWKIVKGISNIKKVIKK